MRLGQRGQATDPTGAVYLQLTLIISLVVGVIVVYNVFITTPLSAVTTYTDYSLVNTALSDNTATSPDNWENLTEPAVSDYITNAWNASGYLTVTRTDNADNTENGIWYQGLTITTTVDGTDSATLGFSFRVIDNENAGSIVIMVLLDDGLENFIVYEENVTESESASWTSVENDVSDNVIAAGTYTVWLRTEINPVHADSGIDADGSSIIVGWDGVNLSTRVHDDYIDADAQSTRDNLETLAWSGIGLMAVAIIIIAAAMILAIVRGFGTGGKV